MKEEFEALGKQLKELAIKYGHEYFTLAYVNGSIMGNSSPSNEDKNNYIEIYIPREEESEE
jgi:hypothetical protein